jgi:hypothetical protein
VLLPRITSGLNATNSAAKRYERPSDRGAEPHNELPPSHTCLLKSLCGQPVTAKDCEGIRTARCGESVPQGFLEHTNAGNCRTPDRGWFCQARALMVDPNIMRALIWHRSGGEPWSFTVPGERRPEVYRTVGGAIGAAHAIYPDDVSIGVGLTGLPATSRSATAVMFAPCPNIALAARQIRNSPSGLPALKK